ncbi:hypothetical protein E1B28_011148 [Marasmius oreades]|uniref:Uncharacterized protein n=1 Tax=Marasmius oreades TaxID=181124 RepID=A0A9P7UPN4_9AGAR|nr:uncharacterized protein E1B28_011148 [Marasmius oreades]KAG7089463.1 hypothetical protein E1B28_011148 [Marasmius oreades]
MSRTRYTAIVIIIPGTLHAVGAPAMRYLVQEVFRAASPSVPFMKLLYDRGYPRAKVTKRTGVEKGKEPDMCWAPAKRCRELYGSVVLEVGVSQSYPDLVLVDTQEWFEDHPEIITVFIFKIHVMSLV